MGKPGLPDEERDRGKNAKLLFLTMIPLANQEGFVSASLDGLADFARLTESETEEALEILEGPDRKSRNKANEGRRVKPVEGGWQILGYERHWERMTIERRKAQMRAASAKHRQKVKRGVPQSGSASYERALEAGATTTQLDAIVDNAGKA